MKVIIHAYKEGRKIYYRGDFEVLANLTLESVFEKLGKEINEPLIEILEDKSDYTIVVLNDRVIEFDKERNRVVKNGDTLKVFPQVVGG